MATSSVIVLRSDVHPQFCVPSISAESTQKTTELLQKNHNENDIIFTDFGLHTFALGARPQDLEKHYANNVTYQRPPRALDEDMVAKLDDPTYFIANLQKTECYRNYMVFFQRELEHSSYQDVVNETLFKGDEKANIMFNRSFSGFYHPIIHLGFGIEFQQPAIIAEALGETAIHPDWEDSFFLESDRKAKESTTTQSEHMLSLVNSMANDSDLVEATKWGDENKIRDGVLKRALAAMTDYASRWRVAPGELQEKLAEITNIAAFLAGAAQHPPNQVKFDFYLMHAVNATVFFAQFMKQDWISPASKVKLLEWRGRYDLLLFSSRGSPKLHKEEIVNYRRKHPSHSWKELFERASVFPDDGHTSKLVRAFAHGRELCAPFEHKDHFPVKDDMWLQLAHMAMDSVQDSGVQWVRSAGFEEAWEHYANRGT